MAQGKGGIIGGIITLVIGGVVYSVNQTAVVQNFSKDTGMTQQEAKEYVENVKEDDLVAYDELGSSFISEGQDILKVANETDCNDYSYEWETNTLSCDEGKSQLAEFGNSEIALGKAFIKLSSESATTEDISSAIQLIDQVNANYNLEIISEVLDNNTINESKKTNSFNKALLQAALDSKTSKD